MRHQVLAICLVVLALRAKAVPAPSPETPPSASPVKTQVVHAGKLIDVRTGRVTQDAYIVIKGQRIESISTQRPPDAGSAADPMIDMSRYTIVPGLIDAHGHILSDPTTQSSAAFLLTSAPEATVRGVSNLQLWLSHGFTVVRDACESYSSYPQFALREGVARGLITGPRIVAAGSCVSLTGGHGDADRLSPDKPSLNEPNQVDTVDDVSRIVRRDIKYGADWIKLMATGGVMDPISDYRVQELSDAQMARAVEDAHRAGHKVMAHAEGTIGIRPRSAPGLTPSNTAPCLTKRARR